MIARRPRTARNAPSDCFFAILSLACEYQNKEISGSLTMNPLKFVSQFATEVLKGCLGDDNDTPRNAEQTVASGHWRSQDGELVTNLNDDTLRHENAVYEND